jgi:hypothetical protein
MGAEIGHLIEKSAFPFLLKNQREPLFSRGSTQKNTADQWVINPTH